MTNTSSTYLSSNVSLNLTPFPVDDTAYTATVYGYISPIVILMTIVNNTFVCIVLLQHHMRSPTNLMLVAMAIADSLTGVIPAPSFIYFYTFGAYRDLYVPYQWCRAYHALNVVLPTMCHTISIWLTVALSVQRYVYVCHPVEAKRLCTLNGTARVVVVICIIAIMTQSTPLFEWTYIPTGPLVIGSSNKTVYGCYRFLTEPIATYREFYFNTYWWFRVVFIHLVPCTSLIVLNARLFMAMRAAQVRSLTNFVFFTIILAC